MELLALESDDTHERYLNLYSMSVVLIANQAESGYDVGQYTHV
jgi:hypothetical protein